MEVSVIAVSNCPADDPGTGLATPAPLGRKVCGGGTRGFTPGYRRARRWRAGEGGMEKWTGKRLVRALAMEYSGPVSREGGVAGMEEGEVSRFFD